MLKCLEIILYQVLCSTLTLLQTYVVGLCRAYVCGAKTSSVTVAECVLLLDFIMSCLGHSIVNAYYT